jgi:hypothetical protein
MGIIAWIVLGLGAGLIANMLIPGKRSQGLIITCLIALRQPHFMVRWSKWHSRTSRGHAFAG